MMRARRLWALASVSLVAMSAITCWTPFATAQSEDDGQTTKRPSTTNDVADANKTDIARCIDDLASAKFDERQAACQFLLDAGSLAIDGLENAAKKRKLEAATRCVEILHQIAREKKNEAAAIAALERLAKHSSSRVFSLAAQIVTDYHTTDEERAIVALIAQGIRISRSSRGEVYSVTIVSDAQVRLLKHLPQLRYVHLSGKGVTNASIEPLGDIKQLSNLTMMNCLVNDAGLKKIKALASLEGLNLYNQRFTRGGLRHLKHVRTLKRLALNSFDENALGFLLDVTQIDSLTLSNVQLSQYGVGVINQLKNLKRLALTVNAFDDERLRWFGQLKSDLSLTVMNSPKITDEGWRHLAAAPLRSLSIIHNSITDRGLFHIGKIKSLQTLTIYRSPISDAGIKHLQELKSLRYLMLQDTKVTEEGMARLKGLLPSLRTARLGAIGRPRPRPGRIRPHMQEQQPIRLTVTAPRPAHIRLPAGSGGHGQGSLLRA
jgi:hypothetical protein